MTIPYLSLECNDTTDSNSVLITKQDGTFYLDLIHNSLGGVTTKSISTYGLNKNCFLPSNHYIFCNAPWNDITGENSSFSVMFWGKRVPNHQNTGGTFCGIFSEEELVQTRNFWMGFPAETTFKAYLYLGSSSMSYVINDWTIENIDYNWHHYCFQRGLVDNTMTYNLFYDGTLVHTINTTVNQSKLAINYTGSGYHSQFDILGIGNDSNETIKSFYPLKSKIQYFKLFNIAITQQEINDIILKEKSRIQTKYFIDFYETRT